MAVSFLATLLALFGGAYLSQRLLGQQMSLSSISLLGGKSGAMNLLQSNNELAMLKRELSDYHGAKSSMDAFKALYLNQSDPALTLEDEISDLQVNVSFADAAFSQLEPNVELLISEYNLALAQVDSAVSWLYEQNSLFDIIDQRISYIDFEVTTLDTSGTFTPQPYVQPVN